MVGGTEGTEENGTSAAARPAASAPLSAFRYVAHTTEGVLECSLREEWTNRAEPPTDQTKMCIDVDEVCAVLRARYPLIAGPQFQSAFHRLAGIAEATFNDDVAHLDMGRLMLEALKNELITLEGVAIKNDYLKRLLRSVSKASFGIVLVAFIFSAVLYGIKSLTCLNDSTLRTMILALQLKDKHIAPVLPLYFGTYLAATMWGVWLSFSVRSVKLDFLQLQHVEKDMLQPWSRLLTIGLLGAGLLLMFYLGVFELKILGISTEDISKNIFVAAFAGMATGFVDKILPTTVGKKFEDFFASSKASG
jgi:hypothetical protein